MSYSFEESVLNGNVVRSGASFDNGAVLYSAGGAVDSSAFVTRSTTSRAADTTSRIASDLLLGANAVGVSGGANAGSVSYSTSYSTGAGASAGSALALGNSSAYVLGAGAGAAFVSGAASANSAYLSEIEQAILRSSDPITLNESEEITVNGQRGIWANRAEVVNWRGAIPITQYLINEDANPELITKRSQQTLEYIQELAIRYLRPPTPPAPGEIIIQQQANMLTAPAPPLIIRQQPARPATPEPLVVREAPPQPPAQVGSKNFFLFQKNDNIIKY